MTGGFRSMTGLVLLVGLSTSISCSLIVDGSALGAGCPKGMKECAGSCVSESDADFGCAGPGCSPCALNRATATCSPTGQCAVASCVGVYEDCDRDPENGCEVNTDQDPKNCGRCDSVCSSPTDAEVACGNAACYILSCKYNSADCNYDIRDGCETDLATSQDNCGECDKSCSGVCESAICLDDDDQK